MKILNGRTIGDFVGQPTYIGPKGCSTVDYIIATENAIAGNKEIVQKFLVEDLNRLSDHRPLTLCINSDKNAFNAEKEPLILEKSENRKRKPKYNHKFEDKLNSAETKAKLKNITKLVKNMDDKNAINTTLTELEKLLIKDNNIPTYPRNEVLQPHNNKQNTKNSLEKQKYKTKEPWYNIECRTLKRKLNYTCKALNKTPKNPHIRGNFFKLKKAYKKLLKQTKLSFEQNTIKVLEESLEDKTTFWKIYKNIMNKKNNDDLPNPNDIQNFYEELYSDNGKDDEIPIIANIDINVNKIKDEVSNQEIDIREIKDHVRKLKNNKATGVDDIMNEMLKVSNNEILELYKALFNRILKDEIYPLNWNYSLTQLIYKEGEKDDPSNYRGISLSSNLGKLFNSILVTRLNKYLEENNIIRKEQGGFRKDHRTSDHIFILQTLIQKYTKNKGKLYGCFVDLKKAFDSVWRKGLIHKLREIGINQKTVNLIENIYNTTYTSLIYKNKILPEIQTTKGVKQGDNLSPLLFNIYVNDLPKEIEKGDTQPLKLNNQNINSLMWADDIVLLSETKEGLQNCLNNLHNYCQIWKLEVNLKKTKIMIFRVKGIKINNEKFYLGILPLQRTREYTYLGISLNTTGSMKLVSEKLTDKARRAWFAILKIFWKSKQRNISTYLNLFDKVIKPIVLYSCEVWGMEEKIPNNVINLHTSCELFHIKCCKNILGVSKKTTNIATLAELGRYPLYIDIHKKMIKYFLRFETLEKGRLLYESYIEQINEQLNNQKNWLSQIKDILNQNGFTFVFNSNETDCSEEKSHKTYKLANEIHKRSKEIFEQKILCHLEEKRDKSEGKLVFYSKLKSKYGKELYLELQNVKNRNVIRNIRISTHKLNIETGRYQGIERDKRFCDLCKLNKTESEEHFLIECPIFDDERELFLNYINENTNMYTKKLNIHIIRTIMTTDDLSILNAFGRHLRNCFDIRKRIKE